MQTASVSAREVIPFYEDTLRYTTLTEAEFEGVFERAVERGRSAYLSEIEAPSGLPLEAPMEAVKQLASIVAMKSCEPLSSAIAKSGVYDTGLPPPVELEGKALSSGEYAQAMSAYASVVLEGCFYGVEDESGIGPSPRPEQGGGYGSAAPSTPSTATDQTTQSAQGSDRPNPLDSAFVTPSDNIACVYRNDFEVWCYVRSSHTLAVVNRSGAGRWAYARRNVRQPAALAGLHGPVLEYGAAWKNPGSFTGVIRCVSRSTSLSCFNGDDTGFTASREAVRVQTP